ncbi:response regulator [Roseiarcaceae bacterium H3SJ34-1]|uniref:hybrid sensor histidine kinase/response regulator n=1 Tax=Terripilifer ovatus TaxID=3032367 RepID=UPI003AB96D3F|nr:response regulator [Roseiarcaceae bacterium H3SJ34-1]
MSYNRISVYLVLVTILYFASRAGFPGATELLASWRPALIAVPIICFLILAHIVAYPGVCHPRRLFAILVDLGSLTALAHVGDESTTLVYPFFLWVIFGNGFRFGVAYLFAATAVAVAGFCFVLLTTPFWIEHRTLGIALLVGLIGLPAYVSVLIRRLSDARIQAEEANRAKSLFMASISHELRTPLNAVIGFSSLLASTKLTPDQAEMAISIGESGSTLLKQINSILEFSRLEAGKTPINKREFDLFALMMRIGNMVSVQANAKGVAVRLRIGINTPNHIVSGEHAIEDILTNLVANAVKFTSEGSVTISADVVASMNSRSIVRIGVTDTGIGIAEDAQARIFESFTQADETIIDRFGGTGLGLAITKRLVEALGGTIAVDSKIGEGSTFRFDLEVDIAAAGESSPCSLIVISADRDVKAFCGRIDSVALIEDSLPLAKAALARAPQKITPDAILIDAGVLGEHALRELAELRESLPDVRAPFFLIQDSTGRDASAKDASGKALSNAVDAYFTSRLTRPIDGFQLLQVRRIAHSIGPGRSRVNNATAISELGLSGVRVLVAEDNKTNQKVIGRLLNRAGVIVQFADNGEIALSMLEKGEFDLALMDINMPVMNGIEATKLYRFASMGRTHMPIVALTADVRDEITSKCIEAGMDECLPKPIEPDMLFATIARLVPDERKARIAHRPGPDVAADARPAEAAGSDIAPIDKQAIEDLLELGGPEFVAEIVDQFVTDAVSILRNLSDAVAQGDVSSFHDHAHALRSCAANVGAQRMRGLCLDWRDIEARELAVDGEVHIRQLEEEFARVVAELSVLKAA